MMFENKIAIVTGGTGFLGSVIVERLAERGVKVYIPVRSLEKFKSIFDKSETDKSDAKNGKLKMIYALECDYSNPIKVKEFVEAVYNKEKKIDFLINTIGGYHPAKNIADMEMNFIHSMMQTNFISTFLFSKNALKYMIKNKSGKIIATGAKAGIETSPGKFAYSMSKSAVINLMQTISEENKRYNITANSIIPSIIDTKANRKSMPDADYTKWIKPESIADKIIELLSENISAPDGGTIRMY
jgi:NAD(P)-dependent dehydrogenase (short-subunit alcohol dehydrogenase family)